MKPIIKTILLSILLILLAACDNLRGVGLDLQILTFTASPELLGAGETSTLAWSVIGGEEDLAVTLTPGDVELDAVGEYEVSPSETTVYTLSISSEDTVASKQLTVTVNGSEEPGETPEEPGEEPGEEPSGPGEEPGEEPEPEENVLEGDTVVTNQAELDALAGVTKIEGSLSISTDANTLDFTPSNSLNTITGNLSFENPNLTEIDGFASLTMMGTQEALDSTGSLSISSNPRLVDIKGFGALETASALIISSNDSLKTFSAFEKLERARVYITNNAVLETLPEFSSLTDATPYLGGIVIVDNPKLSSLNSFAKLTQTGGLLIEDNDTLRSITGFAALDKVFTGAGGNDEVAFRIRNNNSLIEVTGFENATEINGFGIDDNPKLELISGFSSMTRGGNGRQGFTISNNPELEQISGFDALERADPGLFLTDLPRLTRIPSFENLKTLSFAGLRITNTGLTSVDGFAGLSGITTVTISANSELVDLTGFSNLGGASTLDISFNPALTSVSGFDALTDGSNSTLSGNTAFDCSAEPQTSLGFFPLAESSANLIDCPSTNEDSGDVAITTQADLDALSDVTEITGDLIVNTTASSLDFSPLSNLNSATDIRMVMNPNLTRIEGFDSLETIEELEVRNNPELTTLVGFLALESADRITVSSNAKLALVEGFGSLVDVKGSGAGSLEFSFNNSLLSINGFETLKSANLELRRNEKLESIPSFDKLESAIVEMSDNTILKSVGSFSAVTELGNVTLDNMPALETLDAFNNVQETFAVVIRGLGVAELAGFDNLTTITGEAGFFDRSLLIGRNQSLTTISGFGNLTSSAGEISIEDNSELQSISGLNTLPQEVGSLVSINQNEAFDCSAAPQSNLPFLPVGQSVGNAVDCPSN